MHALLFDRRSLALTGAALAGLGALLFAAGFVLGVTVSRERELVPPRWVEYGPLPPDAVRLSETSAPAAEPAAEVRLAAVAEPAVEDREEDAWVPFARPGEVEALLEREIEAEAEPSPERTPVETTVAERAPEPPPEVAVARSEPAAEPVAPSPPPAPTVHAGSWYVQTGAFSVPDNARAAERDLESRFAGRSYRPYTEPITDRRGRRLLTVRLGPFPSRDAAAAVAADFDDVLVGRQQGSRL